jgi:cobalt/nickel transport system permease protein
MSPNILAYGLNNIYIPKKMIYLILITYKYIFILESEYQRLICAIKLRNFSFKTNMHTYRTYSYLIGMLFVRAYDRAKRVNNAMICRNFNGKFFLTKKYNFNWQTFIFVFFSIILIIILIFLEIRI